jgi:hypothetical protein
MRRASVVLAEGGLATTTPNHKSSDAKEFVALIRTTLRLSPACSTAILAHQKTRERCTCIPAQAPSPTASETECGVRAASPQAKAPGTEVSFVASVRI